MVWFTDEKYVKFSEVFGQFEGVLALWKSQIWNQKCEISKNLWSKSWFFSWVSSWILSFGGIRGRKSFGHFSMRDALRFEWKLKCEISKNLWSKSWFFSWVSSWILSFGGIRGQKSVGHFSMRDTAKLPRNSKIGAVLPCFLIGRQLEPLLTEKFVNFWTKSPPKFENFAGFGHSFWKKRLNFGHFGQFLNIFGQFLDQIPLKIENFAGFFKIIEISNKNFKKFENFDWKRFCQRILSEKIAEI